MNKLIRRAAITCAATLALLPATFLHKQNR